MSVKLVTVNQSRLLC